MYKMPNLTANDEEEHKLTVTDDAVYSFWHEHVDTAPFFSKVLL